MSASLDVLEMGYRNFMVCRGQRSSPRIRILVLRNSSEEREVKSPGDAEECNKAFLLESVHVSCKRVRKMGFCGKPCHF